MTLRSLWYRLCGTCNKGKSKTVRYAFPFVIAAAIAIMSIASVTGGQQSYITLETKPESVREGEQVMISVYVTAHTPINAVDITIDYPEAQMDVTGVDTGESVITLWTEQPYADDGHVYLRGGTFQKGFLGKHLIAKIRAKATESGTAYVAKNDATFVAGDGKGTEVPVADDDGDRTKIYIANADGTLVGEATVFIVTDINGDGKVGLDDISKFMSAWFNKESVFDFNGDGKMTFRDFSILLADSFFK